MTLTRLAIGIVSGGLDSLLAVKLVQEMDFEVKALHFIMGFEPVHLRHEIQNPNEPAIASNAIVSTGAQIELVDIRREFMPLLVNPAHGFGANLNPCIDCKILMLSLAQRVMQDCQAAFVFSGEVQGQRPMSQRKQAMDLIERKSGLTGKLVRPLCGALLPETIPERAGLFERSHLLDIQGRSRRRQAQLAADLGLREFPSPAGGCLLTDPQYSKRLADMLERRPGKLLNIDDPLLLLIGRHLKLPEGGRLVVGRNQQENEVLLRFSHIGLSMEALDVPGPTSLLEGSPSTNDLQAAASLTARYGKGRSRAEVEILVRDSSKIEQRIAAKPGEPDGCEIM